jgi:hypothetical protein
MLKTLALLLLLIPGVCLAQIKITGKVINTADQKPIANASVFLNNAIVGDKTADDGTFTLSNVKPGQYTFIVTAIGFETHSVTLMAGAANIVLADISLAPKTIMLQEVNIRPDPNRQRNYADFKRLFLGTSDNAALCKILNHDVVDVDFDTKTMILSATSNDDFIEVENKALGYLIKYKLSKFSYDAKGFFYYEGLSVFQEMKGSKSQQRKWVKQRQVAYLGSSMHFYVRLSAAKQIRKASMFYGLCANQIPIIKKGGWAITIINISSRYTPNHRWDRQTLRTLPISPGYLPLALPTAYISSTPKNVKKLTYLFIIRSRSQTTRSPSLHLMNLMLFLITTALLPIRIVSYLKVIGAKAGLRSYYRLIMSPLLPNKPDIWYV